MIRRVKVSDILSEAFIIRVAGCSPNKQSQEINDFSLGKDAVKWAPLILKVSENVDNVILERYVFGDIYKKM